MADRHRHPPLFFRPASEAHRDWLAAHARQSGRAANAILAEALAEYIERHPAPAPVTAAARRPRGTAPAAAELARERARDNRDDACDHPEGRRLKNGTYCPACGTGGLKP